MRHLDKTLIVLAGLPLSGKSTIGNILAKEYDVNFFDIDQTRREIDSTGKWHGADKEREIMLKSYLLNHEKAARDLRSGKSVIVSSTYSRDIYHQMLRDIAIDLDVSLKLLLLQAPESYIPVRLQKRIENGSKSNISNLASYQEVRDRYVPFSGPELTLIDTSQPIKGSIKDIVVALES